MNRTEHTAKTSAGNRHAFANRAAAFRFRGSRLSSLRLAGLVTIAVAAALSLVASPASAANFRASEPSITGANGNSFQKPVGLTVDASNNLWVSDTGTSKVTKLSPSGSFLAENDGSGSWAGSQYIQSLASGQSAGEIYVGDANLDDIWGLNTADATNSGVDLFGEPWDTGPHIGCCFLGLAVDNSGGTTDGDIYVLSRGQHTITRIKADGSEAPFSDSGEPYISGNQITGPFSFGGEYGRLTVDTSGNVWVSDELNVYEYAASGELKREIIEPLGSHEGQVEPEPFHLTALAVDPTSGNLLVSSENVSGAGTHAPYIAEFSPSGALEARYEPPVESPFNRIESLALDSTGRLYAADPANGRVAVFSPAAPLPIESDGGSVRDVTATSATLAGSIDPNEHRTSYYFQYGTSSCALVPSGCAEVPVPSIDIGSGASPVSVAQEITGLQPGTHYFYRLIAENVESTEQLVGPEHIFTTPSSAPFSLLDNRGWELVSPVDKHGQTINEPNGFDFRAASDGHAVTYSASGPTESAADSNPGSSTLFSTRAAGGWKSTELNAPYQTEVGSGKGPEYRFFSEDLSEGVLQPFGSFNPALSAEASEQTAYLRKLGSAGEQCTSSCYRPLVTGKEGFANVAPGVHFGEEGNCPPFPPETFTSLCGPKFVGATPDLGHIIIKSAAPLTPGAPTPLSGSLYEWDAGHLSLISVLPDGEPIGETDARIGLGSSPPANVYGRTFHAISAAGSRVVFTVDGSSAGGLYLRYNSARPQSAIASGACSEPTKACTIRLDEVQRGSGEGPNDPFFQSATSDDSRIFFTDAQKLTPDSGGGKIGSFDLYECRVVEVPTGLGCQLTDLTPIHHVSPEGEESAGVLGSPLGTSEDGDSLYFAAYGVLTGAEENLSHETAQPSACAGILNCAGGTTNLYLRHAGETRFIAKLDIEDQRDWGAGAAPEGSPTQQTARVSPDGRYLAFLSRRSLTGYDNHDVSTGALDQELFLYDAATGKIVCASCNPTGGRPRGFTASSPEAAFLRITGPGSFAASVPTWTRASLEGESPEYQTRFLSDSGRLFFDSSDPLSPADTNGAVDVYEFEPSGVGICGPSLPTFVEAENGCVDLISSGTAKKPAAFLDASTSGDDVFFVTAGRLSSRDSDIAYDLYDARVGGSESSEIQPVECQGDACQQPAVPPNDATPGSLTFNGAGNVTECRKGKVKQKGKCVKKHKAKKHHKKKSHKGHKKQKRASSDRGGHK